MAAGHRRVKMQAGRQRDRQLNKRAGRQAGTDAQRQRSGGSSALEE